MTTPIHTFRVDRGGHGNEGQGDMEMGGKWGHRTYYEDSTFGVDGG